MKVQTIDKVIALEKKYCPPHMRCENDLQTNGTLLDEEWCEFIKQNNFLVGLSLDGPRDLHDLYRQDKRRQGSFGRVFRAAQLLRKHGCKFTTWKRFYAHIDAPIRTIVRRLGYTPFEGNYENLYTEGRDAEAAH